MPANPRNDTLAQQLLDAHVAFHLTRLDGDGLATSVAGLAEEVFAAGGAHTLSEVIDREAIQEIVKRSLVTVPASAAVNDLRDLVAEVMYAGPAEAYPLGELVDRAQVERVIDELLALNPILERGMEQLTASPLVGTMASRFMGRIVGEVVATNNAMANKVVPGLGSLMSFGTSTAAKAMGAADKQLEGLLGDTVGKGGVFAVRRMNRIVLETLRDPMTREAVLQVWDLIAERPVAGLEGEVDRTELAGLGDAIHDLTVTTLAHERVAALACAVVDGFFERFGDFTPPQLLDHLAIDRSDIVADLVRIAPGVLDAMRESGDLERIIRSQLEPFYASPEVAALLG